MTAPAAVPVDPDTETRAEIASLRERITVLRRQIADALNLNDALRTARSVADSDAAGYIDRTGLEDHR